VEPFAGFTTATRLVPSGRAVAIFPSPSTNAMRLPSGDQAASVTVVGNVTATPPIVTAAEPSEIKGVPTAQALVGAALVDGDGFGDKATGVETLVAVDKAGRAVGLLELQDATSRAAEEVAAAVASKRRDRRADTVGTFRSMSSSTMTWDDGIGWPLLITIALRSRGDC
jgi:hypothetical protein